MAGAGEAMSRGRLVVLAVGSLMVLCVAWVAWQVWHVSESLGAAADDARALQSALDAGDERAVDESLSRLRNHASDADARSSGMTWSLMKHLPVYGDDAEGVQLVSSVLHELSDQGFADLAKSASDLGAYAPQNGRIPLDSLVQLQGPVSKADSAFAEADRRLSSVDTSGYVGPLRTRYELLAQRVADASSALATAHKSLRLLPPMLGADGPRNYLLLFQNNAEVRATGGLPGAWALVTADGGEVKIVRQGTAADFGDRDGQSPILPVSDDELKVYGPQLGTYFQDANFTPDFPRSAELWRAWWAQTFPDTELAGVLSFDPVAISYLLSSTGPVAVGESTLTSENAVEELLSKPYLESDGDAQNAFFASAARTIFDAVTTNLRSPMDFVRGLQRAVGEGRLHLAAFTEQEQAEIEGTRLEGALPAHDDRVPHIEIALNDATSSKMSYYLRYRARVEARSCSGARQSLLGTMSLDQTISGVEAASLPASVTGGGDFGTQPGHQLVAIRIFAPSGGSLTDVRIDGKKVGAEPVTLQGRPVVVLLVELSGPDDVVITWSMVSGEGQTFAGTVGVTPSVIPGTKSSGFKSAC
jgi:hypothetical protein